MQCSRCKKHVPHDATSHLCAEVIAAHVTYDADQARADWKERRPGCSVRLFKRSVRAGGCAVEVLVMVVRKPVEHREHEEGRP